MLVFVSNKTCIATNERCAYAFGGVIAPQPSETNGSRMRVCAHTTGRKQKAKPCGASFRSKMDVDYTPCAGNVFSPYVIIPKNDS